jgi:uncharacterized protein YciI
MSKQQTFMILLHNQKPLSNDIIFSHVDHLKALDQQKKLIFSGPFKHLEGGVIIIYATSIEEAQNIALSDPFIKEGFKTFEIIEVEHAHQKNNYLI